MSFQIFDQGVMDTSSDTAPLFKFKEALARRVGLDPATLVATVERYKTVLCALAAMKTSAASVCHQATANSSS